MIILVKGLFMLFTLGDIFLIINLFMLTQSIYLLNLKKALGIECRMKLAMI